MSSKLNASTLDRLLTPAGNSMPGEVAEWLVQLHADTDLQARVDELADKNTAGLITPTELAEYDEYLQAAEVIAVLQVKARRTLTSKETH